MLNKYLSLPKGAPCPTLTCRGYTAIQVGSRTHAGPRAKSPDTHGRTRETGSLALSVATCRRRQLVGSTTSSLALGSWEPRGLVTVKPQMGDNPGLVHVLGSWQLRPSRTCRLVMPLPMQTLLTPVRGMVGSPEQQGVSGQEKGPHLSPSRLEPGPWTLSPLLV